MLSTYSQRCLFPQTTYNFFAQKCELWGDKGGDIHIGYPQFQSFPQIVNKKDKCG